MDLRTLDADTLAQHYAEHVGKGFYDDLVGFMSSGPDRRAWSVEGSEDTWEIVRGLMGATNPRKAAPGTIRGDLASATLTENLVHGSDSLASAEREIGHLLPESVTNPSGGRLGATLGRSLAQPSSCDVPTGPGAALRPRGDGRWRGTIRLRSAGIWQSISARRTR